MCKFPPMGVRGCGSPFAPALFGQNLQEYQDTANYSTMIIVQIETPLGLQNCYEIASVPGVGKSIPCSLSHPLAVGRGSS